MRIGGSPAGRLEMAWHSMGVSMSMSMGETDIVTARHGRVGHGYGYESFTARHGNGHEIYSTARMDVYFHGTT